MWPQKDAKYETHASKKGNPWACRANWNFCEEKYRKMISGQANRGFCRIN